MSYYFSSWSSQITIELSSMVIIWCHAHSVTGHQDCHWTQSMVIIWCHADSVVINLAIDLIQQYMMSCYSVPGHQDCHWTQWQGSFYGVMPVTELAWHQYWPLNWFNGHYWCHAIQLLAMTRLPLTHSMSSIIDVMLLSNWSSILSIELIHGHYMMLLLFSNWSSTIIHWMSSMVIIDVQLLIKLWHHMIDHWTHSMVNIWCHAIQ